MTPAGTASDRPLRRDAERNRQRILEAARVVFAERGLSGSHDDIAREAGVGVGTVYRRFPEKEQLIDALFEDRIEAIGAMARAAAGDPDPWQGLVTFLVGMQEMQSEDRALKEIVLGGARGAERVAAARELLIPIVGGIVQRAKDARALRADVELTDLPLLQLAISTISEVAGDAAPDVWRRAMNIVLDGLRAESATFKLVPTAIDEQQLDVVMASYGAARRRG